MVGELHALAGEAALLQLRPLADLARQAEALAKKGESAAECERVIAVLQSQIDTLAR
jgi:HPt (histidine-containing phosphotransfer) domain-containing protein